MAKVFKLGDGDGIGMAEWRVRGPPPAVVGLPEGMRIKTPVRSKRNSGEYGGGRARAESPHLLRVRWAA